MTYGRWRDRNWISSPEGQGSAATQRIRHAGRLRRRGGFVHSIRQEGAALRTVVSSTARTTVHGAAGREAVWNGCRCRTPRCRKPSSARQSTRRTRKVCIPSPIPSACTARCCARSTTQGTWRTRRRVPQSRAYPQSAVPALGDIEAFALQQYFLIDTFCVLMFRFATPGPPPLCRKRPGRGVEGRGSV